MTAREAAVASVDVIERTTDQLLRLIDGGGYNYGPAHVRSDIAYLHDLASDARDRLAALDHPTTTDRMLAIAEQAHRDLTGGAA